MFLKKVEITKYRHLENIEINFEKSDFPAIFSIAGVNGGGKSTILQFIFILLHCFRDERRKEFIKNLLYYTEKTQSETKLARFVIEEAGQDYYLEFIIAPAQNEERNFNFLLDIKEVEEQVKKAKYDRKKNKKLTEIREELPSHNHVTQMLEGRLAHFIENPTDQELLQKARRTNDIEIYKKLLDSVLENSSFEDNNYNALESSYLKIQRDVKHLEAALVERNMVYLTHLIKEFNVLLLRTDMPKELLEKLTTRIFLNAPKSQMFLFLSPEERSIIFSGKSYDDLVQEVKQSLSGFLTYDFASTDMIAPSFEKAFEKDKQEKLETGQYGKHYDNLVEELKNFLDNKEITLDGKTGVISFKQTNTQKTLLPEELSHGELRRLGIYIWLKYFVEPESIVLMDEIDIALHPKWQYQITKNLKQWSENSQFLLATHSPQILSSTYYKNLVILKLSDGKVNAVQFNKPPIDRDINTIITEIMGAPDFPSDLLAKHQIYRKLVNAGKIDTAEAITLKQEILEYESENSAFFQEINFDLELMK